MDVNIDGEYINLRIINEMIECLNRHKADFFYGDKITNIAINLNPNHISKIDFHVVISCFNRDFEYRINHIEKYGLEVEGELMQQHPYKNSIDGCIHLIFDKLNASIDHAITEMLKRY